MVTMLNYKHWAIISTLKTYYNAYLMRRKAGVSVFHFCSTFRFQNFKIKRHTLKKMRMEKCMTSL